MAEIFLSYSREDLERVKPLVTALEKEGFAVWWDRTLKPGESFEELIDREVQAAGCVVVVWTKASVDSQWVRNEALEGMDRKVLVPILMDDVRIPVAFKQLHIAEFKDWPVSVDTDQYRSFIDSIRRILNAEEVSPPELKGISGMRTGGRRRFRRRSDFVTPALASVIVLLAVALVYWKPAGETADIPPPRLAIDRFTAETGSDEFYANSITRELEDRFSNLDEILLVQAGSNWGLDFISSDKSALRGASDFMLSGVVGADDDDVKVDARLEDLVTGDITWKGEFIETEENLLELQRKLIAAVLGVLKLETADGMNSLMLKPVTDNKGAYRDYLRGKDLLSRGEDHNIRDAISMFESALEQDDTFAMAHAAICRCHLELFRSTKKTDNYESAQAHCMAALELGDKRPDVHLALAELYRGSGELDLARLEYMKALELNDGNPDANMGLADIFVKNGNAQAGEELYKTATRLNPTYWKAHNVLGSFYFHQGMYYKAIESYMRVTELTASNATAFSNLGAAKLYAGDFVGAYEAWRKANELDTNSASFSNMGTALYLSGRYEKALEQFETALMIDSSDHRLWGNVGDCLRFLNGREEEMRFAYREAIRLAEQNLSVNPKDASTLSRLAVYYAATGSLPKADEAMKNAEKFGGDDINVLYDLAVACSLLDDEARMQKFLTAALDAGYPKVLLDSDPQFINLKTVTKK